MRNERCRRNDASVPSATNTATTITNLMDVTFSEAGSYTFQITVIDASGLSNPEGVTVTVQQVATSITLNPAAPTIFNGQTDILTGSLLDQFGNPMSLSGVSWSMQSGGIGGTVVAATVAGQAIYTAPASADGSDTVILSVGSLTGSTTVSVIQNSLTATAMSTGLVELSWNAFSGAQYYQVFRDTTPDFAPTVDNQIIDSWTPTSFADDQVSAGTNYYYEVYSVDGAGSATLVGQASVATPAQDVPLYALPTESDDDDQLDFSTLNSFLPVNVQAMGVNDLEIFVSWTNRAANPLGYDIQVATNPNDPNSWNTVGVADAGQTNFIIRGCGAGGAQLLQEGQNYYVRVNVFNGRGYSNYSTPSGPAQVRVPPNKIDNGHDIIVIVGGNDQPMKYLLWGVSVSADGKLQGLTNSPGNSVGAIWVHDVIGGYNAFLSTDPADGGAPSQYNGMPPQSAVPAYDDVLNNDGSGWLYNEILYELTQRGTYNIGLIGYSHGGGMIANISSRIHNDSNKPLFASVVFAATIDAVQYGRGPDSGPTLNGWDDPFPLQTSPAAMWGGFGVNYWEPNGWAYSGHIGVVRGTKMNGAISYERAGDTHSDIGTDPWVLNDVEQQTDNTFSALSF